jgi:hypothetical protein
MSKVKLNFRNLSIPEKISKARQILRAITGNAKFPNPVPPLTALTDGTDNLDDAYVLAQRSKQAWRSAVDVQNKAEDALDQLFSQCARYVESVAGDDDSVIAEAGMDPQAAPGAPAMLEAPSGFNASIGDHEGEIDLSWNPVLNARSYLIQQSTDPTNAAGWAQAGTSTKSGTTISGLTSGTRYWFRVCAVGTLGQSGWSNPDTKIAP